MSNESPTPKEIAHSPGQIIYNAQTSVFRPGFEASVETVRFVLNTTPNANGMLQGMVLDESWELLTDKITLFATIDEFFALNSYLVRNGFAVNPPKNKE